MSAHFQFTVSTGLPIIKRKFNNNYLLGRYCDVALGGAKVRGLQFTKVEQTNPCRLRPFGF